MDLIRELRLNNPNDDRILELLTDENVSYVDEKGYTALMCAFIFYGKNPNYNSNILLKMLDMNCRPEQINNYGYTTLMYVFKYYGKNPNCDSNVILKMLDMNCKQEHVDTVGYTALMYAFLYYGSNPNCNHRVLLKLLDMNCAPKQINRLCKTALIYLFQYYGVNPNYDPRVFLKLIILSHPSITRSRLIELLNINTKDQELKSKILIEYNYDKRRVLIKNRILKRYKLGKNDSKKYFNQII
jgi:hypothetical protein